MCAFSDTSVSFPLSSLKTEFLFQVCLQTVSTAFVKLYNSTFIHSKQYNLKNSQYLKSVNIAINLSP